LVQQVIGRLAEFGFHNVEEVEVVEESVRFALPQELVGPGASLTQIANG
jgi:hypothetical protein